MSTQPDTMRAAFEAWAITILGDNPTWRESGACELAWQSWQAATAQATAIERERCAAICDTAYVLPEWMEIRGGMEIALAIREGESWKGW